MSNPTECIKNLATKINPRIIKKCVGILLILMLLASNFGYAPDVYSSNLGSISNSPPASKPNLKVAGGTPISSLTNKVNLLGNSPKTDPHNDSLTGNVYAGQVDGEIENSKLLNGQNLSINQNSNNPGIVSLMPGNVPASPNALVIDNLKEGVVDENDLNLVSDDMEVNQDQRGANVTGSVYNDTSGEGLSSQADLNRETVTSGVYSVVGKVKGSFPIRNKAGHYSVGFSSRTDMYLFQFSHKNANLTQRPLNPASVKGNVYKNSITYEEIYPNTDLRYTLEPFRLKEEIVVKKYTDKSDFFFQMSVENAVYKVMPDSTIMFYDSASNEPLFYIPRGFAIDNNGNRCDSVSYEFTSEGLLKVSVNPSWLQQAAYPIVIDPTINLFDATFSRSSVAYKQDGTQVLTNLPRYEYARQASPIWSETFDANGLSQYTPGGDAAATWTINGGVLSGTDGNQATLINNNLSLTDGEIEVTSDQAYYGGIIARYQDNNNYYLLQFSDDSGGMPTTNLKLWKRVAGTYTPLGTVNLTWARGTSKTIKLAFRGTLIEAYFGGNKVISIKDTAFTDGKVGLYSFTGSVPVRFLDFKVYQSTQALMIEEGTTNLLQYPKDFTNNYWVKYGSANVIGNTSDVVAPDGTNTADKITAGSADSAVYVDLPNTVKDKFTLSVWLRTLSGTVQIGWTTSSDYPSNGNLITVTDQWQRFTLPLDFTNITHNVKRVHLGGWNTFSTGEVIYAWGIQLEQKPYATSFIEGTRSPETLTIPTAGVFSKGNWTVEMNYTPTSLTTASNTKILWMYYIDANNWASIGVNASGYLYLTVISGGVNKTITGNSALQVNSPYLIMASGDGVNIRLYLNGNQISTDLAYSEPVGTLPINMYIGSGFDSYSQADGIYDDIRISNRARTTAEAQAAYQSTEPLSVDSSTTCMLSFDGNLHAYPTIKLPNATFSRSSVAYKQDGTQVASGSPRYEAAKFNQGIMIEEGTTNLIGNPSFETDISGWNLTTIASRNGTTAYIGSVSLALTNPQSPQESANYVITGINPSTAYTLTVYAKNTTNGTRINLVERNSYGARLNQDANNIFIPNNGGVWTRYTLSITTLSTTSQLEIRTITGEAGPQTGVCYLDGYDLEKKPYATSYIDTNRTGEALTIPTTGVLNNNAFTVEFTWIPNYASTITTTGYSVLWQAGKSADEYQIGYDQVAGKFYWRKFQGGVLITSALIPISFNAKDKIQIKVSHDNVTNVDQLFVGINGGALLTASTTGQNVNLNYTKLQIGSWVASDGATYNHFADGIIDDLRISSIARVDSEIQAAYQSNQALPVDSFTTCNLTFDSSLKDYPTNNYIPTFSRPSIAYKQNGAQVSNGSPRYETGKFNQGLMIEEGTTNKLTSNQSSIDTNTSGFGTMSTTISRDTTNSRQGGASLKMFYNNGYWDSYVTVGNLSLTPNTTYAWSVWAYVETEAYLPVDALYLQESVGSWRRTAGGTVNGASGRILLPAKSWTKISGTGTTTADWGSSSHLILRNLVDSNGQNITQPIWYDMLQVEQKGYNTSWVLGGTTRSSEALTLPTTGVINAAEGTFEFAINRANTLNAYQNPFSVLIHGSGNAQRFSMERSGTTNSFVLVTGNGAGNYSFSPTFTVNPDTWYRVGVTWKNGVYKVYLNGALQPGFPWTSTYYPTDFNSSTIDVGFGYNWVGREANVLFDDLSISSVARTDADMQSRGIGTSPLPVDANTMYKMEFDNSIIPTKFVQENPIKYIYDNSNRLDYITLPSGEILDFEYDNNGNLLKRIKR